MLFLRKLPLIAALFASLNSLHASTFSVVANFNPYPNGSAVGSVIQSTDGNFYGTCGGGGAYGQGVFFKVTPSGQYTLLASFNTNTGTSPIGIVQASDGNFYGTCEFGGSGSDGTVFKVTPTGILTTLASFSGTNGKTPNCLLVQGAAPDTALYGTTFSGGTASQGNVFKITPDGTLTSLASFTQSTTSGRYPNSGLALGSDSNFYGMTENGGTNDSGTAFRVTPSGSVTTLTSFIGSNGLRPFGALTAAPDGNLYGMTSSGGAHSGGTIVQVTTAGAVNAIYSFNPSTGGAYPFGNLIVGSDGNLYGNTSTNGGTIPAVFFNVTTTGTLTPLATSIKYNVFSRGLGADFYGSGTDSSGNNIIADVAPSGSATALYTYPPAGPTSPGAPLIQTSDGTFYGTSRGGGSSNFGTIFKMTPAGTITSLVPFTQSTGGMPLAPLLLGLDNNFYGTTSQYGAGNYGSIFKVTSSGTLTTLVSFSYNFGGGPDSALTQTSDGSFLGTTPYGGTNGDGNVYKLPTTGPLSNLYAFTSGAPGSTSSALVLGSDGNYYGTTSVGGTANQGTAYKISSTGTFASLASFGAATGEFPVGNLVLARDGNFYGVTTGGGSASDGTVFMMSAAGSLSAFASFTQGIPNPGLIQASDGNFYGTTATGGGVRRWQHLSGYSNRYDQHPLFSQLHHGIQSLRTTLRNKSGPRWHVLWDNLSGRKRKLRHGLPPRSFHIFGRQFFQRFNRADYNLFLYYQRLGPFLQPGLRPLPR